ncbi:hypothetical protein Btru_047707 [Bulinus truncatus]|nr:hypothetical protein Btru_047707 [Bulinus truncatus]
MTLLFIRECIADQEKIIASFKIAKKIGLDYVKKSVARNQGKGAHTKGSATRSGSKSNRKGGKSNESDTRVKSWSLLKSKKSAGQTRPPLYLSNSMEEYGGVVTEYPSNRLTYGQGKDWLDPDYVRRMRPGRGGAEWISPGFIEALKEESRASRPKASGPPLRKPHLLPEIPGVEYDRTLFNGWDFGRTLGPKEISKLPGLSERANLMIQRRPPKIPIDNYVKPTENSRVTCAEYLAKYAIHELLQFLMYVIVRERPDKPIDFMIEMTQIINRLIKIRGSTEVRMGEMERAREMRQPV